jgi:hypothetical protein
MGMNVNISDVNVRNSDASKSKRTDAEGMGVLPVQPTGSGLKGIAHNRNIDAAATTHPGDGTNNVATWTVEENVREAVVAIADDTGEAVQSDLACLVVVNAPSDAIAQTWLTDTGSASQDVLYEIVTPYQPLTIQRTSAITQIDVLPIGDTCRVVIAAVGV